MARNPRIIYARGTGHGPRGPDADKGGYDGVSFWARSGVSIAAMHPDAQPDLVSALLTARDEGGRLSEQELLSMLMVVLTAGHETTGNLIGNSVLALFDWPDRRRRLQADPGLLRVASEDVEIGGVVIPAGSVVVCMLASANRDPRRFPAPDEFDVAREDNPHLGFGHGIHFCLGAPLARMEAETALGSLLRRFPDMELAAGRQKIPWRPSALLRGPAVLPVRLRPAG